MKVFFFTTNTNESVDSYIILSPSQFIRRFKHLTHIKKCPKRHNEKRYYEFFYKIVLNK